MLYQIYRLLYKWNYWRVKYSVFGNLFKYTLLAEIQIGGFQYCTERNSCLQYKWLDHGVKLILQSLRDLPNRQIKITVNIHFCLIYSWQPYSCIVTALL